MFLKHSIKIQIKFYKSYLSIYKIKNGGQKYLYNDKTAKNKCSRCSCTYDLNIYHNNKFPDIYYKFTVRSRGGRIDT